MLSLCTQRQPWRKIFPLGIKAIFPILRPCMTYRLRVDRYLANLDNKLENARHSGASLTEYTHRT